MENYKIIILAVTIIALVLSIVIVYLNINLNRKIKYYETPKGVIERAWNNLKEKEYWILKNTSSLLNIIGVTSFFISVAGIGTYLYSINSDNTEDEENNLI